MAKKVATKLKSAAKTAGPTQLMMNLFAPGMSPLHRAGLGGLACTLAKMEESVSKKKPKFWEMDDQSITLTFDPPEKAAEYLQRLFEFAFQITDGLIYLPGQFQAKPKVATLADLQQGLTLTFLQHGKTRNLAKEPAQVSYDPLSDETPGVRVEYRACSWFKHQEGWKSLIEKNGYLTIKPIKIEGPIAPGAVVRHVAYTSDTTAEDLPERMLPLYFSMVGCLALPFNRGVAALLIPEVTNLQDFIIDRPDMSPQSDKEMLVASAADGALQMQVRLISSGTNARLSAPGCHAMTFMSTPWASQQKSRVSTLHVRAADQRSLEQFQCALGHLAPRIVPRKIKETTGKGKNKVTTEITEAFRADSIVRPLIAANIAAGKKWYAGFSDLMTKTNPVSGKPYRHQLSFERKGLHAMTKDKKMWDEQGEQLVVESVHEAIRQTLGQIREETDGKGKLSQATKNRWERFREKLRLDLAGAKTESQVRFVLTNLFSRGGSNAPLKAGWKDVLGVLRKDWQLARDLGLLSLASYSGKGSSSESETDAE